MPWNRNFGPSGWNRNVGPSGVERAIAALCYLTMGIAGIIYIIISRSSNQSDFFRFHFLQSIVLNILSILLGFCIPILGSIIGPLAPAIAELITKLAGPDVASATISGILMLVSAIFKAFSLLCVYGLIWAALGKIAEIPFISNVVRQQMR